MMNTIKSPAEFTGRFELDWPLEFPRIEVGPGLYILQTLFIGCGLPFGEKLLSVAEDSC